MVTSLVYHHGATARLGAPDGKPLERIRTQMSRMVTIQLRFGRNLRQLNTRAHQ